MIRIDLLPQKPKPTASSRVLQIPWTRIGVGSFAVGGILSLGILLANQLQAQQLDRLNRQWEQLQPKVRRLDQTEGAIRALQNRTKVRQMLKSPEAQWAPRLNLLSNAIVSQLWFRRLKIEIPPPPKPVKEPFPAAKGAAKKSVAGTAKGPTAKPSATLPADSGVPPIQKPTAPLLVLEGSALMVSSGGAPVSRYMQRLKEQPEFSRWFRGVELKSAQQRQVQQEQVSDFVVLLYPTGS